jgi:hypothetical protein
MQLKKSTRIKLIILGICYFVFKFIYEFVAMLRYTPQTYYLNVSEIAEYVFIIPSAVVDFLFLFWVSFRTFF